MEQRSTLLKHKRTFLFIVLSGIFLTNALIAEIIGVKIFSLEKTLGMAPAQLKLFGGLVLDFNLTAGVLIWPIVFLTTDLINEYFGKEGVKKISYLTCVFILYSFFAIYATTTLVPADFWLEVNNTTKSGAPFDINYSFNRIFSQGLGIIVGSITAFLISQILDAYVFHYIRKATGGKMLWLRATGSTVISQFIDSFVVLYIAFRLFPEEGKWPMLMIFSVGSINYIYKFLVAVLMTPVIYIAHAVIDWYLDEKSPLEGSLSETTEKAPAH